MSKEKTSVTDFLINERWPASNPELLQFYSMPTPNGQKVSIMLEETGLAYEAHRIPLNDEGTTSPEFMSLNPNNKIPAIIDPNGPDGKPLALFESGAILIYLAEKTNQFFGNTDSQRYEVIQWLMFQMAGLGPMTGQFGYFYTYAGKEIEDKRPLERYVGEVKRLLNVMNLNLENRDWLAGDYSIADMAVVPWLNGIEQFYEANEITGLRTYENVSAYMERFNERKAVQVGRSIPS